MRAGCGPAGRADERRWDGPGHPPRPPGSEGVARRAGWEEYAMIGLPDGFSFWWTGRGLEMPRNGLRRRAGLGTCRPTLRPVALTPRRSCPQWAKACGVARSGAPNAGRVLGDLRRFRVCRRCLSAGYTNSRSPERPGRLRMTIGHSALAPSDDRLELSHEASAAGARQEAS